MRNTPSLARKTRSETGQAIVIIALGFIVLLGFTGLVVDVARVFTQRGELRRAVDSAGLAATSQFKTGATGAQIKQAAINLIRAHGITDPDVVIKTCNLPGTDHDSSLCSTPNKPRKLVSVKASAPVPMLFLQLIGINNVAVEAESIAEAASVDVVLVLDTSESQAYDPPSGYAYAVAHNLPGDPNSYGCQPIYVGSTNGAACTKACNDDTAHPCYPLQKIKDAANAFIDRLYNGYDRAAIVSYQRYSYTEYPLGIDLAAAKFAIQNMRAYDNGGVECPFLGTFGQRWKCGSSNPGGALKRAGLELTGGVPGEPGYDPSKMREDSLWVTVFLSSGGMNATDPYVSADLDSVNWGFCPYKNVADPLSKDYPPTCRDQRWSVHHTAPAMGDLGYPLYDAEDYAYDNATYLGKKVTDPNNPTSLGVLIYTIALGQKAVCTTGQTYSPGPPVVCANWTPGWEDLDSGLPNTGELFLRYTAAIGDDGNPNTDPCVGVPSGVQCGNYYFAPSGNDLLRIFLEIAGRIFTRISG